MTHRPTPPVVLSLVALAAAAVGLARCGDEEPAAPPTVEVPARTYDFQVVGPRPQRNALWVAIRGADPALARVRGLPLHEHGLARVEARPGDLWLARAEERPTPAERSIFWFFEERGTFGDTDPIEIHAPERATIAVLAPTSAGGADYVTVYVEETGHYGTVIRDPVQGLLIAAGDADGARGYRETSPARPLVFDQFAPGKCVVAARMEGRQWGAQRADLSPGNAVQFRVSTHDAGGGTVICEDGGAVLMLRGEFPIPAPVVSPQHHYRALWEGVPPGEHQVRYPGGASVAVQVSDGGEVRLPKQAPTVARDD